MEISEREKELKEELKKIQDERKEREFQERCNKFVSKGFKISGIQFTIAPRNKEKKLFAIGFWNGNQRSIYVKKSFETLEEVREHALKKLGVEE